jgi:hypothetical protein
VVVSWVNGDTGEYGLKVEPAEDPDTGEVTLEAVYAPYDDEEHRCDWEGIKPDWTAATLNPYLRVSGFRRAGPDSVVQA